MHAVRGRLRIPAAALAALLFGVALLSAQAPANQGRGFMWRVERDGRVGWLVGSLHVLTPDYYPLPAAMQQAFAQSSILLEEADVNDMGPDVAALVASKATYSGQESLKTELPADLYNLTAERLAKAGLSIAPFERMKPWMVSLTLALVEMKRAGFDPALGVDRHFYEKAGSLGKKFRTLETVAEQLNLLASFPPPLQEAMLRDTLRLDSEIQQMQAIAQAWRVGDAATLERTIVAPMMALPDIYQALIVARNRNWVPKIEGCLAEGQCFVVVGAAHLVGRDGLIAALEQKGYVVRQQ